MVKFKLYPDCLLTTSLGYVRKETAEELREKGEKALMDYCYDDEVEEAFWPDGGDIYSFLNLPTDAYWDYDKDFKTNLRNIFETFGFSSCTVERNDKETSIYDKVFASDGFPEKSKILFLSLFPSLWTKGEADYDNECEVNCTKDFLKAVEKVFWGRPLCITSKSGKPIIREGNYTFEDLDDIDPEKLLFVVAEMDAVFNEPFDCYKYLAGIYYGDDVDKIMKKAKEKENGRETKYNYWMWLEQWIDEGMKNGELNIKKAESDDELDMDLSTVIDYMVGVYLSYDEPVIYCDFIEVLKDLYD